MNKIIAGASLLTVLIVGQQAHAKAWLFGFTGAGVSAQITFTGVPDVSPPDPNPNCGMSGQNPCRSDPAGGFMLTGISGTFSIQCEHLGANLGPTRSLVVCLRSGDHTCNVSRRYLNLTLGLARRGKTARIPSETCNPGAFEDRGECCRGVTCAAGRRKGGEAARSRRCAGSTSGARRDGGRRSVGLHGDDAVQRSRCEDHVHPWLRRVQNQLAVVSGEIARNRNEHSQRHRTDELEPREVDDRSRAAGHDARRELRFDVLDRLRVESADERDVHEAVGRVGDFHFHARTL
jgi:hypothetical protein